MPRKRESDDRITAARLKAAGLAKCLPGANEYWQIRLTGRLAAMLEWKPGPPTEPGFFAFTLSSQGLPYCEQFAANDFELGVRPWLKEVVWHIGPLPFPPEGSVFSK